MPGPGDIKRKAHSVCKMLITYLVGKNESRRRGKGRYGDSSGASNAHVRIWEASLGFSPEETRGLNLRGEGRQGGNSREGNVSETRATGERGDHGTLRSWKEFGLAPVNGDKETRQGCGQRGQVLGNLECRGSGFA